MGKESCPAPGPPCYTLDGSIMWKRNYFTNPIVSAVALNSAQVLDIRKQVLFNFIPFALPGIAPFFYYVPDRDVLTVLRGHEKVIYQFNEAGVNYEFEIKIS